MSEVCETCHAFKVFGKSCWYYWERKKSCSQYKANQEDIPHYQSVLE